MYFGPKGEKKKLGRGFYDTEGKLTSLVRGTG